MKEAKKTARLQAPPGAIFYSVPKGVFINYGKNVEDWAFPQVAQVVDSDLDTLQEIGIRCWEAFYHKTRPPLFIRVTKEGEDFPKAGTNFSKLINPQQVAHPFIQELITDLNAAIRNTWTKSPQEILDLYSGATSPLLSVV